ncbi:MAG: hypothetical protein OXU74_05800 [Gemmatimonadota bacterium]|nr:hypothetical protein [Gemmatimonadota bacterium]
MFTISRRRDLGSRIRWWFPRAATGSFLPFPIALGALIALGGCGNGEDGGPSAETLAALRPTGQSAFDSSEHPDLSELSSVVAGFFLPDSGLALVERSEIHLIDLSSGGTQVVGREGEGPREFRHIGRAVRTPHGIAAWDVQRQRLSLVSRDGEFVRAQGFLEAALQGFFNAYPVAVHPDGRVVFRDGIDNFGRNYEGRTWNVANYVTVRDDGELELFAEAEGNEHYYGSKRSGAVVFNHRTLQAATEDGLIIAETHRGSIAVLDWNGREVAQIPMPAGVPVPDARAAGRQVLVAQWQQFAEQFDKAAASGSIPFEPRGFDESEESDLDDWPINEVAPAIDALLTDFDERLWVRDYQLPNQDSVIWRVWDIDRQELLFTVRMDGEDTLLDARDDLVLLRRLDQFDVPRAVAIRLLAPPGDD